MKAKSTVKFIALAFLALSTLNSQFSTALAQGTAFTYQGQLQNNGSPASGTYALRFSLFATNTTGVAIAGPVTNNGVTVNDGLFTVTIDFGPGVFTGTNYWLEIGVETNGASPFTTLSPRQPLTPSPYAVYAGSANTLTGTLLTSQLTSFGNTNYTAMENFFIGPAGNSTTTGFDDTAVGFQALRENTTGYANTAYGYQALEDNATGFSDTAIGYTALAANFAGYQNTAVGEGAMYMSGTGNDNSAFGQNSLGNNAGSFNVAIGEYALWSNGTGSYNTANGAFASYALAGSGGGRGSYNTANGYSALYYGGSGSNNVADGAYALYQSSTGGNNIALGYAAGTNISTGSFNIDIGNPGAATDTNIIRIGNAQIQAFIAGVITGNGAGLTNLNATNLTGAFSSTQLPAGLVTNNQPSVTFGNVTVGGGLNLSGPTTVYSGGNSLLIADGNLDFYAGPLAGNVNNNGGVNTALGFAAMFYNAGGSFNAAVGAGALGLNTVGDNNTALGYEALYNNLTGSNNVANGYWALNNNTSGYNNTANGYEALYDNSSGYYNTADGYNVLNNNTTGYQNTAMGHDAMKLNRIGYQNVAVGDLALGNNTDDNQLVAIGYHALQNDNAGQSQHSNSGNGENTGVGYEALANNTFGYGNTALGFQALELNQSGNGEDTSGEGNTGIGDLALGYETSGNNNTAVGYSAGSSITTGSDNIDIGNIGVSTDSGIIRIGTPGTQTATYLVGTVNIPVLTITGGADLAEPFPISPAIMNVSAGEVVVIDAEHPGQLKLTDRPYDTHVAGVVSGANGIHPGIQMHQEGLLDGGQNVALSGRVYVQADASNGAIEPGDLLTTSSTPGRAMKVSDHLRAQGAILGKAMTSLKTGDGMVLVLVTLQ